MGYRFRLRGIKFMAILVMLCTYYEVLAQPETVKKFWYEVKLRREYKLMPVGLNAWLGDIAKGLTNNSYSEASALLENIHKEKPLQDRIFLEVYCNNYASKESLRYTLANLCGSYSIGNPVSDYIITTYSNDKRAINIISKRRKQAALEEREKVIKDSIRATELANEEKNRIKVEKMPEYNGDLWGYINSNLKYPKSAVENGISGNVIVMFTVTRNGDVIDCNVKRRLGGGLDEEAIRVVQLTSGKWKPGTSDGLPVDVKYELRIGFKLN